MINVLIKYLFFFLFMVYRIEKNVIFWFKERLKLFLKDLEIEIDEGRICIEE